MANLLDWSPRGLPVDCLQRGSTNHPLTQLERVWYEAGEEAISLNLTFDLVRGEKQEMGGLMTTDDAPITQFMVTVQFTPSIPTLNPVQLADIFSHFREEYPIFEQAGRAGSMPVEPAEMHIEVQPAHSLRNVFRSVDRQTAILFQEDRFSLAWGRATGLGQPSGYPGFATLMDKAYAVWQKLLVHASFGVPVQPLVGEIIYTDNFEMGGEGFERLSSIYSVLNPAFTAKMHRYNFSWVEPFDGGYIQAQIAGPGVSPQNTQVTQLETTTRFRVADGWPSLPMGFENAHNAVGQAFQRLINPVFRPI